MWNVYYVKNTIVVILGYCSMYIIVTAMKVPLVERGLKSDEET